MIDRGCLSAKFATGHPLFMLVILVVMRDCGLRADEPRYFRYNSKTVKDLKKTSISSSIVAFVAVVLLVFMQFVGLFGPQSLHQGLAYAEEGAAQGASSAEASAQATAGEVDGQPGTNATAKDEVVYARLQASGAVENIYVVNTLLPESPGSVTDYGKYNRVENLSNLEPITQTGDAVTMKVTEDSASYQGNLESSDLPWMFAVDYYLNGRHVTASELAGQSGTLKLTIKTTKNDAVDAIYYDNYLLQISVVMASDKAQNVQTSDGTIALVGTDSQVTFTGMPESDGSFGLTADVTDFEMAGISFAAVPMSVIMDSPDINEYFSGFTQLTDGVGQLNSGADELASGAQSLSDGMAQMAAGASGLSGNMNLMIDGAEGFRTGLKKLDSNGQLIAEKSDQFSKGLQGISASTTSVAAMLQDPGFLAFIATSPNAQEYMTALQTLVQGLPATADGYVKLDEGLQAYMQGVSETSSEYEKYSNGLVKALDGAGDLADGVVASSDGASKLAAGANELSDGTGSLYTEVQGMPDEVQKQIDQLLADFDRSDFKPTSFTSTKNTNVDLVQFVIASDPIEVEKDEAPVQEAKDEGVIARLLALFGM